MSKDTSSEHLRAELKNLADTLEEVLSSSPEKSKGESSERIAATTREAAQKAEGYVRENPWHGVGIGAAIGVALGMLISRR